MREETQPNIVLCSKLSVSGQIWTFLILSAKSAVNFLQAFFAAEEVITAARDEYRKETICEGRWTEQLLRRGIRGEDITIRDGAWDCPGMSLQFPNSETTAAGFVLNEEGGCL